ncbi:MAG: M28 family peptidase [Myxococcales bacterium]|nr:M28 family peptidase [Myxococcales bacterium]
MLLLAAISPEAAGQLVGGAMSDGVAYSRLEELSDTIGPRLSGSPGAEAAVSWAFDKLKRDGLSVRLEPVKVPHWVRGEERGEILPRPGIVGHPLYLTALGGSVGGDVTGEVIEARSLKEVAALGSAARGKIIFLNHTMGTEGGYGQFVELRSHGPVEAAKVGAAGVLLRSLATASLRTPHTGVTQYEDGVPRIPAAAITTEDAALIHRLLARGPVRAHFTLGSRWLPDADSANVVADVRGREKPDEVVLLGAHLDSWDLAEGSNDDGAGVAMVMEAGRLIASLKTPPRRTVRVVLFMNEENGLAGGKGYAAAHAGELGRHVVAMEADSGAHRPIGIVVHSAGDGAALLKPWLTPLASLGLDSPIDGETGGADIGPLAPASVPFAGVSVDGTHYFDLHHSPADTFDHIDAESLAKDAAAYAVLAYAFAEMPQTLARPPPAERKPHSNTKPSQAR